jgi:glycosyltransferase involved in cell wall biosynthesis
VFIPCYNCGPQIGRTLARLQHEAVPRFAQVLVLDNCSCDDTVRNAIAAAPGVAADSVIVAKNCENYGLGGSHKAAFAHARTHGFSHIVVLHGDDQGDIGDLAPVLGGGTHHRYDACLGARFMRGARLVNYAAFRVLGNQIFNALFSLATRRIVADLGSGLNIFGRSIIEDDRIIRFADDLRFNVYLLLHITTYHASLFFPISWREDDQISNVRLLSQALGTLKILGHYLFRRTSFRNAEHRAVVRAHYPFDIVWRSDAPAPTMP